MGGAEQALRNYSTLLLLFFSSIFLLILLSTYVICWRHEKIQFEDKLAIFFLCLLTFLPLIPIFYMWVIER